MKRALRALTLLAVVSAVTMGVLALSTPADARGRCVCPQVYAPVECDNGRTYPNQCVADCRNATGCVPVGAV